MKISILRKVIREELVKDYLLEQGGADDSEKKKDTDYDISQTGAKVTGKMKKAMDPNANPAKFAAADEKIDQSGSPKEQAGMLAKFALDYTDGDAALASKELKMAAGEGIKGLTATPDTDEESSGDGDGEDTPESTEASKDAGDTFKKGMGEGISKSRMAKIIREEIARYYMGRLDK